METQENHPQVGGALALTKKIMVAPISYEVAFDGLRHGKNCDKGVAWLESALQERKVHGTVGVNGGVSKARYEFLVSAG